MFSENVTMKDKVTLDAEEQKRLKILNETEGGKVTKVDAAALLGVSVRHVKRLLAAYRGIGVEALAHGNRGRKPGNALDGDLRQRVIELSRSTYLGFNTQHLTEVLEEREGIVVSRSSVRRILLAEGSYRPRKRRAPRHRSRRERYPQEGMLLQIDASQHDWLEGRGPRLSLVAAIDDATGRVVYGLFREQEDAQGYFLLLRQIVENEGIPLALYHDRHSIFEHSRKNPESLAEQLEGGRTTTQFGRLLDELAIRSISSNSPQARGRIERLWGTMQSRLVSELRLAGACTCEAANQVLWSYLPHYSQTFGVCAAVPGSVYRKPPDNFRSDEFFCFKYFRTAGADNVVRLGEHRLQLLPSNGRMSYARTRVEVHERLDGSLAVFYHGQWLAHKPAPPETPTLRARHKGHAPLHQAAFNIPGPTIASETPTTTLEQSVARKPSPDHPWRRRFKTSHEQG